ncbi:MAG: helix-turn-helix transcriptional regulator, partial [bacterium]|nr:helix-turn-helix transcriptional regulator [bacterium]
MSGDLLQTKLYMPRLRPFLIPRPHLIKQLNQGLHQGCKLTLISAPAGFGKTTLVAEWIEVTKPKNNGFAWVSLDHTDNDPMRFFTYFIAGLQKVEDDVGEAALDWLQSAVESPTDAVLAGIINDIVALPYDVTLIFDDFHLITEPAIHEAFAFLLDNQPPNLHLIIISRADPPWPLARLRARRQLNEIRARDLRFTMEETAVFLNNIMGLNLSPEDVVALDKQTEGWIAGLQMIALSMQRCDDTAVFIQNFSARHAYILDYLVEEVLERQPPRIQAFLLQTAILERMSAPLCDAVTQTHSQAVLNQLDQANLFLIPLDDERRWYRYHHLFADLLRYRLEQQQPDLPPILHRRASEWFAQAGLPDEAVTHALASNDMAWSADCIEQAGNKAVQNNREVTLSGWLDALPQEQIRKRPWLCIYQAYIAQWMGNRDQVAGWLQCAEQSLKSGNLSTDSLSVDECRLAGGIATLRAHNALIDGDIPTVVEQSELALTFLADTDDSWHGNTRVALGGAYWALGDVVAAEKTFALAAEHGRRVGDRMLTIPASCYVGIQQSKRGRLHEAWATYQEAREQSVRADGRPMPVAGFPLIKMGDLQREWNDLDAAQQYVEQGVALCVQMNQFDVLADTYVNLA